MNKVRQLSALFIFICGFTAGAATNVFENWHWTYPAPQGNGLLGSAYGNGLFVAVGRGGAIVTSTNGSDWLNQSSPVSTDLRSVAYGNNCFVAVGFGATLVSTNGFDWNSASNANPNRFLAITYGANLFVAVGALGTIQISEDGINWTNRSVTPFVNLTSVAYGNGIFIAVDGNGRVMTSSNGVNWVSRNSPHTLQKITFGNNVFIATPTYENYVYSSTNGISWSSHSFGGIGITLYSVGYGTNGFVVMGDQMTANSSDGTNWIRNNNLNGLEFDDVIFGDGIYLSVGQGGSIQTSPNGAVWASQTGPHQDLLSIAYGNSNFVAAGRLGTILTSSNGSAWQIANSGTSNYFYTVDFCNGNFFAAGIKYNGLANILRSSDGFNWTNCSGGESNTLHGFAFGNGVYVAVGASGIVLTSTDGSQWNPQTTGISEVLYGVAFGNGTFAAVGDGGKIITSADGTQWKIRNSRVIDGLRSIVVGNGKFVAVGGNYGLTNTILTSVNGVDWQIQNSGLTYTLQDVSFGNGTFVALTASSIGTILTSFEGIQWTQRTVNVAGWPICFIAYGNSTFVAAGSSGGILQSASTTTPILNVQNEIGLGTVISVTGEVGRNYRLQYSSNLNVGNWSELGSFTNNSPVTTLTNLTSDSQRFYRVVSP